MVNAQQEDLSLGAAQGRSRYLTIPGCKQVAECSSSSPSLWHFRCWNIEHLKQSWYFKLTRCRRVGAHEQSQNDNKIDTACRCRYLVYKCIQRCWCLWQITRNSQHRMEVGESVWDFIVVRAGPILTNKGVRSASECLDLTGKWLETRTVRNCWEVPIAESHPCGYKIYTGTLCFNTFQYPQTQNLMRGFAGRREPPTCNPWNHLTERKPEPTPSPKTSGFQGTGKTVGYWVPNGPRIILFWREITQFGFVRQWWSPKLLVSLVKSHTFGHQKCHHSHHRHLAKKDPHSQATVLRKMTEDTRVVNKGPRVHGSFSYACRCEAMTTMATWSSMVPQTSNSNKVVSWHVYVESQRRKVMVSYWLISTT